MGICKPGKTPHGHAHRQILALHKAGRDMLWVWIPADYLNLTTDVPQNAPALESLFMANCTSSVFLAIKRKSNRFMRTELLLALIYPAPGIVFPLVFAHIDFESPAQSLAAPVVVSELPSVWEIAPAQVEITKEHSSQVRHV